MVYNGGAVEHTHRFPHILSFFFSSARRVPPPPAGKYVALQVHEPGAAPLFRNRRIAELENAAVGSVMVFSVISRIRIDLSMQYTSWGFESLSCN